MPGTCCGSSHSTPLLDLRFTVADLSGLRRRVADCGRLAALPDPGASEAGRGLWLVQELSDRLHIGGDLGGAIVTLEFELAGERPGVAAASRGAWLDDAWGPFGK